LSSDSTLVTALVDVDLMQAAAKARGGSAPHSALPPAGTTTSVVVRLLNGYVPSVGEEAAEALRRSRAQQAVLSPSGVPYGLASQPVLLQL
jgi:hypothetical protein